MTAKGLSSCSGRGGGAADDGDGDDFDELHALSEPLVASGGDVCAALMARYGKSPAPHHRHLVASAVAIRSILTSDSSKIVAEPSPAEYLAAALPALQSAASDADAVAALAAFLSTVIPLIVDLPYSEAKKAASILSRFLGEPGARKLPTGTVRSLVKALGSTSSYLDFEDSEAVLLPFETLLSFTVDKRPKVRKCSSFYLANILRSLRGSRSMKTASNLVLGVLEKYFSLLEAPALPTCNEGEVLHFLNFLSMLVPSLSKKAQMHIFPRIHNILESHHSNVLIDHILKLCEAILDSSGSRISGDDLDKLVSVLVRHIRNNGVSVMSTTVFALRLLEKAIAHCPSIWMAHIPAVFEAASGCLCSADSAAKDVAVVLKNLLNRHSLLASDTVTEMAAMKSICATLERTLGTHDPLPENLLVVIAVLFLKFGESMYDFMEGILLRLSDWASKCEKLSSSTISLVKECIGCAVISMGPEKVLSVIPIVHPEKSLTFSNIWIADILSKYTIRASLKFFTEYVVPLAAAVRGSCSKAKSKHKQKKLESYAANFWNMLPAFCRYPADLLSSFGALAVVLMAVFNDETCPRETISVALQELVNGLKRMSLESQDGRTTIGMLFEGRFSLDVNDIECGYLCHCSEKSVHKNLKVLASHAMDFIRIFVDAIIDAGSESPAYLKDTAKCLSLLADSADLRILFVSLLKRFDLEKSEDPNCSSCTVDDEGNGVAEMIETQRNRRAIVLDLIPVFAEAADENLLNLFYQLIESSLLNGDDSCHGKAYFALTMIMKDSNDFCIKKMDELMVLLSNTKTASEVTVQRSRLSCFQQMLLRILKVDHEEMNQKAFLILNEIIVSLKMKKEARKLAYDMLLETSRQLKSNEHELQRLFTMVMGYLSAPSPHIVSGAVSALALLIYDDAEFCLTVPNVIPSVLILLRNKAIEVIKAALGFVKVLASSLRSDALFGFLADIAAGILPWSGISKHHFRGKVAMIIEILLRKCGFHTLDVSVPPRYKGFVKKIADERQSKKSSKNARTQNETAVQETSTAGRAEMLDRKTAHGFRERKNPRRDVKVGRIGGGGRGGGRRMERNRKPALSEEVRDWNKGRAGTSSTSSNRGRNKRKDGAARFGGTRKKMRSI